MTRTKNIMVAIAAIMAVAITPYAIQAAFAVVNDSVSVTAPPNGQMAQKGNRLSGACHGGLGDITDEVLVTTSSMSGNVVEAKYDASQCSSVSSVDETVYVNGVEQTFARFFTTTGDNFYNGLSYNAGDIIKVAYTFNVT
ncbi:hypothetical protein [Candidatus Nitrosotalea sp. FS]|uniref:hypothetical protein n=1 Tax=Candidatus Nitrosotalea sp. FS TaxID=2341021 RepID=UPI00140E3CD8|nr:hypothetical protein [Candidatus Nitrosotalea sp. FS]